MFRIHKRDLTIQAVTKSPIHVPTAAIFIKLSFLMPMYSVTMWGLQGKKTESERDIKNLVYVMRVVKAGRKGRRWDDRQKEPTEGECRAKEKMVTATKYHDASCQSQSISIWSCENNERWGSTFHKALRIVNNLHQCNGIYAVSPLSFGPVVFGNLSICLANLSHV